MKSLVKLLLVTLFICAGFNPAHAFLRGGQPSASSSGGSSSGGGGASLPALSNGNAYADVRGTVRMIQDYTGPLYKLSCTTCTPTTMDIAQDANGRGNESGAATWNGGAYTTFDGFYSQTTGNYVAAENSDKKMLWNGRKEGDVPVMVGGWNATVNSANSVLYQGYVSEAISVNRNNVGLFAVVRSMGATNPLGYMQVTSAGPTNVIGGTTFGHTYRTNSNLDSFIFPIVNQLGVYGLVGKTGATVLHLNQKTTTKAALTSSVATAAYLGVGDSAVGAFGNSDYAAIVVTAAAPTDIETDAIKAALYDAYQISTDRRNILIGTPHSLTINANPGVFNDTVWRQMMPYLSEPLATGVVGINGQAMSSQLTKISELTARYEASADHVIYYLGTGTNDINYLASMGGSSAAITANATTIYNTYISVKNALVAQGAKVKVIVATGYQPVATFWSGDAQLKLDKAQVLTEWNQMVRNNAIAEGYVVCDEATINMTGALGDSVHTNRIGEGRRAALLGPIVEAIITGPSAANDNIPATRFAANDNFWHEDWVWATKRGGFQ